MTQHAYLTLTIVESDENGKVKGIPKKHDIGAGINFTESSDQEIMLLASAVGRAYGEALIERKNSARN